MTKEILSTREQLESMLPEGQEIDLHVLKVLAPHESWIEEHPHIKGHKYIPIGIIEDLLDIFFGDSWDIDINGSRGQSDVAIKITLIVTYPRTGQKRVLSGIAALPIRSINDVEGAYQMAKSFAIKDAVDHLGKIFGRDLNRDKPEPMPVRQNAREIAEEKNKQTIADAIINAKTIAGLQQNKKHAERYNLIELYNQMMEKLK